MQRFHRALLVDRAVALRCIGVTRQLLWEEYCQAYSYSQYCPPLPSVAVITTPLHASDQQGGRTDNNPWNAAALSNPGLCSPAPNFSNIFPMGTSSNNMGFFTCTTIIE